MLTDEGFNKYCTELGFSDTTVALINKIRTSPPYRHVGGGSNNVWGRYPSNKMKLTIQFESHKVELAGIIEYENDADVLEFYDQPSPIKLCYRSLNGRNIGVISTPDFLVIRQKTVSFEEWKTEKELLDLSRKSPGRYVLDSFGKWCCPPAEEYATKYGLCYNLRSSKEINWPLLRNLQFLEDYYLNTKIEIDQEAKDEIISIVENTPNILLIDILKQALHFTADDIYFMIARNEIYVDINTYILPEPDTVHVYINKDQAEAYAYLLKSETESFYINDTLLIEIGNKLCWDGIEWQITNFNYNEIYLHSNGKVVNLPKHAFDTLVNEKKIVGILSEETTTIKEQILDIFKGTSPKDLKAASYRANHVQKILNNEESEDKVPERTLRYWLKKYKDAEMIYGNGFIGLIPRTGAKGNRGKKLPDNTLKLMEGFINNDYETVIQKNRVTVYGALLNKCEAEGVLVPSYQTFCTYVNNRNKQMQIFKREGKRAAYKQEMFYWELTQTTPRHGDRPFQIAHIDHTELDEELNSSRTQKNLGRPWATFLTDAFDRRPLAFYLSYDKPSYRSCMMVLRDCVRRHGRLPKNIVMDGGREFDSIYFETLLAFYKITKKVRPSAKARFGSVIERLFGTTNKMFIHNLEGNTKIMKNVRQVTKSVNPKNHSVWTLIHLYRSMEEFLFSVYDTKEHPALGQSPKEAYELAVWKGGLRSFTRIPYDETFKILTLPSSDSQSAKVQVGLGIRVNYIYYWSELMKGQSVENTVVPVRYDPYNIGIAYAYINRSWVECISEYYPIFKNRTEKELQLITSEIKRQKQNSSKKFSITAKRIADFIRQTESDEKLLLQRQKDSEGQEILRIMDGRLQDTNEDNNSRRVYTTSRKLAEKNNCSAIKSSDMYEEFHYD